MDGGQTIQVSDTTGNTGGFWKGYGGLWQNECTNNCGGWLRNQTYYYYGNVNGSEIGRWAKWQPTTIPVEGGIYEIYVYVPGTYTTSWQVPYTIRNDAGTDIGWAVVDQKGLSDQWVSIGVYRLKPNSFVYVTDATGETAGSRQLAVDDVMFVRRGVTYAPDVRNSDGWLSKIILRNNGGVANFLLKCLRSNGSVAYAYLGALNPHATTTPVCLGDYTSLVLDASQDVSLLVEHERNSRTERANYSGVLPAGSSPSPTWNVASALLYAPVVKNNYYGVTSSIYVMNTGTLNTTVSVSFYQDNGALSSTAPTVVLAPGGKAVIGSGSCLHALCSAKISASGDQPLAVVVDEHLTSGGNRASIHNTLSGGANTLYVPVFKDEWYGISSGLRIQNVGSGQANVTIAFYNQNGSDKCNPKPTRTINANGAATIWDEPCVQTPGGFLGSVQITSNQPIAAQFNEISLDWRSQSSADAVFRGSRSAYGPLVYKDYWEDGQTWLAGVTVQNTTGNNANVTLRFFTTGTVALSPTTAQLSPYAMNAFFAPTSGFKGSVIVQADQDVVTAVNVINFSTTGDPYANYNAISR